MGQIRIPRITTVDRTGLTMAVGELVYDTDDGEIYKGDGATAGGIIIGGSGTVTSVTASTPLSSSGGATPNITIANAAADGTTKGAAAFTASDFNASSGVISIDYTNGQAASGSNKGFLTSADWTTFNSKVTSVSATSPITSTGGATPSISTSMNTNKLIGRSTAGVGVMEEISIGTGLTLSAGTLSSASTNIKYGAATQASAGVYTSTITGVSAYTTGDVYVIKFDTVNDGASTLNINSIGAVNIYKNTSTPISSGDIKANQTVELVYDGTNFQAIGLIPSQLLAYVHNSEGAVINKGQVVYAYQATGDKMSVKLARADSDATSAKTIGLVYDSSIGIGGEGYIIIQGVIEGLNTAAYSAGDTLYLSGTTYGAMTNTKPYAPTHLVYVGIVEKANAGAGQIYVRCQNGYELDEIHNVDAFNPNNNDGIFYNTGTSLWEHKSIATVLGYTPASNAITISTSTPLSGGGDLSANRTISIADAVADGSTKGAATFTASDFNSSSGLISIDYANGQKASGAQDGFLSSTDWTTFNNKLSGNQTITLSGDVSGSGATSISTTIGAGAVTLSKMANLTANTIIGNNTGVAATPLALTGTQVTAMLDTFSTSATTKGLVTGSNGLGNTYFLRADGTWAVPAGGGGSYTFSTGLTDTSGTITANLSTGVSGGQSVIGGTAASNNLTLSSTSNATKGKLLFGSSAYDEANNRLGIQQASPTSKLQLNNDVNSVTINDADGLFLANATAAIAGTQSASPALIFQGNGYKSNAPAASEDIRFRMYVLPSQGATAASGTFVLQSSFNGAAYSNVLTISPAVFSGPSSITASGIMSSTQLKGGTTATAQIVYRTTNAGSNVTPHVSTNTASTAGSIGVSLDVTNALVFSAGNGTRPIARAAISITNLTNTAGSESGDLQFLTQSGGTAISEKMRIFAAGNVAVGTTTDSGFKFDVNGTSQFQDNITIADAKNIILNATTGTKVGTATTQKLGFWNAAPIAQPTTGVASATRVGGGGTTVTDTDTFDGYTISQVVKALRNAGLLA